MYYEKIDEYSELKNNETNSEYADVIYEELKNKFEVIGLEINNINIDELGIQNSLVERQVVINNLIKYKTNMENIKNITVALENGQYFSTQISKNNFAGIASEGWYVKAKKLNNTILIGKKISNGSIMTIIATPIHDENNQFLGVVSAEIEREMINQIIEENIKSFEQVIIKDEISNILYMYNENYNLNSNDEVINIYEHNTQHSFAETDFKFDLELYYSKVDLENDITVNKDIFSYIFLLVLSMAIIKILTDIRVFNVHILTTCAILLMFVEVEVQYNAVSKLYDQIALQYCKIISFYNEEQIENSKKIADNMHQIIKGQIFDKVFNSHVMSQKEKSIEYIESELLKKANEFKHKSNNIISIFLITKEGKYKSFPNINHEELILFLCLYNLYICYILFHFLLKELFLHLYHPS